MKSCDAGEFVRLRIYLPGKTGVALIERDFHIVDNLTIKALIGIDIIKPEGIVLDVARNLTTITSCNNTCNWFGG